MTEQDWAEATRLSSTLEEYKNSLLIWSDWVEEEGYDYAEGLRWLSREGRFPAEAFEYLAIDPGKKGKYYFWFNATKDKYNFHHAWQIPGDVFFHLSGGMGHYKKLTDQHHFRSYSSFRSAIRDVAISYMVSLVAIPTPKKLPVPSKYRRGTR